MARATIAALIALALALGTARAAPSAPDADTLAAIRNTILAQQQAFARGDAAAAFALAAPRLHDIFRTPAAFLSMVKRDYLPVYRPKVFSFRPFAWIEGRPVQPVLVVGPDDVPKTALYLMERETNGSWLIAGVVLVPEPDKGT